MTTAVHPLIQGEQTNTDSTDNQDHVHGHFSKSS